jgi:hypothetical protein
LLQQTPIGQTRIPGESAGDAVRRNRNGTPCPTIFQSRRHEFVRSGTDQDGTSNCPGRTAGSSESVILASETTAKDWIDWDLPTYLCNFRTH